MNRSKTWLPVTVWVAGLCVLLAVPSPSWAQTEPAADDPVPFVINKPAPVRTSSRILGIGWTVAGGTTIGDRSFPEQKQPTFDIGAELRLFPRETSPSTSCGTSVRPSARRS